MQSQPGVLIYSLFTDWHRQYETFELFGWSWNVGQSREIIMSGNRNPIAIDVTNFKCFVRMMELKEEKIHKADLAVPLIVVPVHHYHLPIDGWHRIASALSEGRQHLPGVLLTVQEASTIFSPVTTSPYPRKQ